MGGASLLRGVEEFIWRNGLDEQVSGKLRLLGPAQQYGVIVQPMHGARNPSAVVWARVRAAQQDDPPPQQLPTRMTKSPSSGQGFLEYVGPSSGAPQHAFVPRAFAPNMLAPDALWDISGGRGHAQPPAAPGASFSFESAPGHSAATKLAEFDGSGRFRVCVAPCSRAVGSELACSRLTTPPVSSGRADAAPRTASTPSPVYAPRLQQIPSVLPGSASAQNSVQRNQIPTPMSSRRPSQFRENTPGDSGVSIRVEEFVLFHGLDERCATGLRQLSPEQQIFVMTRDFAAARNKNAVVWSRVRAAQRSAPRGPGY